MTHTYPCTIHCMAYNLHCRIYSLWLPHTTSKYDLITSSYRLHFLHCSKIMICWSLLLGDAYKIEYWNKRRLQQFGRPGSFVGTWFLLSSSVHLLPWTFADLPVIEPIIFCGPSYRHHRLQNSGDSTSARVDVDCLKHYKLRTFHCKCKE